jgi:hypothetical protein
MFFGAGDRSRTYDLRITNALLYQLSYTGNVVFVLRENLIMTLLMPAPKPQTQHR